MQIMLATVEPTWRFPGTFALYSVLDVSELTELRPCDTRVGWMITVFEHTASG